MNLFNNCFERNLDPSFKWMNEPEQWSFSENKVLTVTAPPLADFFHNPMEESKKDSAPFLYVNTNENFILTTQLDVDMRYPNDSGCLMIMAGPNHWAKLCYENFRGQPSIISVVTKHISDDCIGNAIGKTSPFLRISRFNHCIAFHYSIDGNEWFLVRYFGMEHTGLLKIGVVAQSPVGEGCAMSFKYLRLVPNTNKDVRSIQPDPQVIP
jgi:regulation of enolase protein 1 (concanavalin A-like superfamily)